MPRCCGGATCSCVIDNGAHIQIVGTGTPADPFIIAGDIALEAQDNTVFDVVLSGLGTVANPWKLSVNFASTAKLNDLPDVNAPAPANGQVLGYDTATGQWTNRAPTTASAGAVLHDPSLAGDGSAGAPLQVAEDPARLLATAAGGLGLSDTGMNATVRKFADATARAAASPPPTANTLSLLASNPGQVDYWTGTAWAPAGVFLLSMAGNELYQQSGPYTGGQRVTYMVRKVTTITDDIGLFDVIPAVDLAGKAGVISATVQVIAADVGSLVTPYSVIVVPSGGAIKGATYRLDDGQPLALSPVSVTVTALVY